MQFFESQSLRFKNSFGPCCFGLDCVITNCSDVIFANYGYIFSGSHQLRIHLRGLQSLEIPILSRVDFNIPIAGRDCLETLKFCREKVFCR